MSLRYALLGFISTEPASGFDLAREFGESMGWFWYASHSQIYPELRRLEEDGLVTSTEVDGSPGKQKRIYRITEQGGRRYVSRVNVSWAQIALLVPGRSSGVSSGLQQIQPRAPGCRGALLPSGQPGRVAGRTKPPVPSRCRGESLRSARDSHQGAAGRASGVAGLA